MSESELEQVADDGDRMMNGKLESEWEQIHLPDDHVVREGCAAKTHVPQDRADRDVLWQAVKDYQQEVGLPPFMSQDMLAGHALLILVRAGYTDVYQKWTMVMLHNESERPNCSQAFPSTSACCCCRNACARRVCAPPPSMRWACCAIPVAPATSIPS